MATLLTVGYVLTYVLVGMAIARSILVIRLNSGRVRRYRGVEQCGSCKSVRFARRDTPRQDDVIVCRHITDDYESLRTLAAVTVMLWPAMVAMPVVVGVIKLVDTIVTRETQLERRERKAAEAARDAKKLDELARREGLVDDVNDER